MERSTPFARCACALILAATFCTGGSALAGHKVITDPDNGMGPNNRPAFLIVSVAETFDLPVIDRLSGAVRANAEDLGSPVVLVNIGTYFAGDSIETTRFKGLSPIAIDLDAVPPDPDTGLPPNFDGHQFTIVGSFRTLAPDDTVHMMTPYPGIIAPQVQQAFFNASAFFGDEGALSPFPSTVELALFVYDHQLGAGAGFNEIMTGLFAADPPPAMELVCHSPCES